MSPAEEMPSRPRRRKRQRRGLGNAGPQGVDPGTRTVPRGAVVDGLAVGPEPRRIDGAALERQALEGGLHEGRGPAAGEQARSARERESRARSGSARTTGASSARRRGDACGRASPRGPRKGFEVERATSRADSKRSSGFFSEAVPHDAGRDPGGCPCWSREVRRLLRQDRRDRVCRRVAAERPLTRQHLVEDRPEREEVVRRRPAAFPRTCSGAM